MTGKRVCGFDIGVACLTRLSLGLDSSSHAYRNLLTGMTLSVAWMGECSPHLEATTVCQLSHSTVQLNSAASLDKVDNLGDPLVVGMSFD
jgi:hypothetical protein